MGAFGAIHDCSRCAQSFPIPARRFGTVGDVQEVAVADVRFVNALGRRPGGGDIVGCGLGGCPFLSAARCRDGRESFRNGRPRCIRGIDRSLGFRDVGERGCAGAVLRDRPGDGKSCRQGGCGG